MQIRVSGTFFLPLAGICFGLVVSEVSFYIFIFCFFFGGGFAIVGGNPPS